MCDFASLIGPGNKALEGEDWVADSGAGKD
jgi:hypothetical protein